MATKNNAKEVIESCGLSEYFECGAHIKKQIDNHLYKFKKLRTKCGKSFKKSLAKWGLEKGTLNITFTSGSIKKMPPVAYRRPPYPYPYLTHAEFRASEASSGRPFSVVPTTYYRPPLPTYEQRHSLVSTPYRRVSTPSYEQRDSSAPERRVPTTSIYGTPTTVCDELYIEFEETIPERSTNVISVNENQSSASHLPAEAGLLRGNIPDRTNAIGTERQKEKTEEDFLLSSPSSESTWVVDADVFEKLFGIQFLVPGRTNENDNNNNNDNDDNSVSNTTTNSTNKPIKIASKSSPNTSKKRKLTKPSKWDKKKKKEGKQYNPFKDVDLMTDVELVQEIARRQKERQSKRVQSASVDSSAIGSVDRT